MLPGEMQSELMTNIQNSLLQLLGPGSISRYIHSVLEKRRQGQPVSFTDIFGHLVGETLLKGVGGGLAWGSGGSSLLGCWWLGLVALLVFVLGVCVCVCVSVCVCV